MNASSRESAWQHGTIIERRPATRRSRGQSVRRVLGAVAWHGVMLLVCAFVLIPIVMVMLGSFKIGQRVLRQRPMASPSPSTSTITARPGTRPISRRRCATASSSTGIGVFFSTILACFAAYGLARFRFAGRTRHPPALCRRTRRAGPTDHPAALRPLPPDLILGSLWSLIAGLLRLRHPPRRARHDRLLRRPPERPGRRRPDRRRQPLRDLPEDHAAADPPGHRRGRHPQRRLDVERLLPRLHPDHNREDR